MNQKTPGELKFACPGCGQHIAYERAHSGMTVACPTCQAPLIVPIVETVPLTGAPAKPRHPNAVLSQPDQKTWLNMGAGLLLAVVVTFVPFLDWIFHYLGTIIHELGHWVVRMFFAYPALPAFSFEEGGFTVSFSRMPLLLLLIYGIWLQQLWRNRRDRKALLVIGTLFGLYVIMAHTGIDQFLAVSAGHATQLLIAAVFLFRAWSGSAILVPMERPLYAAVGFHITGGQLVFAWKVLSDHAARDAYIHRENAINDFIQLQYQTGLPLNLPLVVVLLTALSVPILSFLAFRYQARWRWEFKRRVQWG
jgi:hypothetical protein